MTEQTIAHERALDKLRRDLGPLVLDALNDPRTVEVVLNPDGKLWRERLGERLTRIGAIPPAQSEALIRALASYHHKSVTRESPLLECELPLDGSRFAGQLPPVVAAPSFAIRKRALAVFPLADYVTDGVMSPTQRDHLVDAVRAHRNILVIGGTGTGKTTLINALIAEMVEQSPDERLVLIEDMSELQCAAEDSVIYRTSPDVSMTQLLRTTLRMRPDRILVGEVRGPEALDLLDCWNTGHPGGAATLHADDAESALIRLVSLISRNPFAPRLIEPIVGEAVHLIVHIVRTPTGRRVESLLSVNGWRDGRFLTSTLE